MHRRVYKRIERDGWTDVSERDLRQQREWSILLNNTVFMMDFKRTTHHLGHITNHVIIFAVKEQG